MHARAEAALARASLSNALRRIVRTSRAGGPDFGAPEMPEEKKVRAPVTSAPGPGPPLPHLRRDRARVSADGRVCQAVFAKVAEELPAGVNTTGAGSYLCALIPHAPEDAMP